MTSSCWASTALISDCRGSAWSAFSLREVGFCQIQTASPLMLIVIRLTSRRHRYCGVLHEAMIDTLRKFHRCTRKNIKPKKSPKRLQVLCMFSI